MAMLAEPKRKQKFSFDPRNTNWSNDETKFGHKLMEKMGWTKGKGLGAKEDGHTENIAVSVKNDTRGVGCSKSHVDNWIAHQDDFNALLANLGQDHSTGDGKQEETDRKVTSLEHKSRTSKGRLHYQKFTKGKDLSLKSETDLDCVFGKRKAQSGTSTPQTQSGTNTPQTQSEPNSDNEDQSHGFNTVTSTDSVQDYFKKKMAERLNKLKGNVNENATQLEHCSNSDDRNQTELDRDSNEMQTKSKNRSRKRKLDTNEMHDQDTEMVNGETEEAVNEKEIVKKKSKKSKKKRKADTEGENKNENETNINELNVDHIGSETVDEEKISKKKSKKKKRNSEVADTLEKDFDDHEDVKTNLKEQSVESQECIEESISEDKPKKKKNKKRKRETTDMDVVKPKKKVSFLIGDDDSEDKDDDNVEDGKPEKNGAKEETTGQESRHQEGLKTVTQSDTSYKLRDTSNDETNVNQCATSILDNVNDKSGRKEALENDLKYTRFTEIGKCSKDSAVSDTNTTMCNKNYSLRNISSVREVKLVSKAFRGANMARVKGYTGMRITSEDVKRKLNKV